MDKKIKKIEKGIKQSGMELKQLEKLDKKQERKLEKCCMINKKK